METLVQTIQPGDDVIIVENNRDDLSIFDDTNGTVQSVTDNKAVVHFHKEFSYLFGYEYQQGKTTKEFDLSELKTFNIRAEPKIRAERLYKDYYHHLYVRTYKFSPENTCMHKDCHNNCTKRILFNCWGSVSEFDVCEEHAEFDGMCGDGFPSERNYEPKIKEMYH